MSRVMMPGPQGATNAQGTALVHYPTSQQSSPQAPPAAPPISISRFDEQEPAFERPPPKNAELFNPKGGARNGANGANGANPGRSRANTGSSASELMDKIRSITLSDTLGEGVPTAMPTNGTSTGEPATAGEAAAVSS